MRGFVVDDNADRAEMLAGEISVRGFEAQWLRPTPPIGSPGLPGLQELHIDSRDTLDKMIKKNESEPGIWFWDVGLAFPKGESIAVKDYKPGGFGFSVLKRLLDRGHVVVLTSTNAATSVVKKALVADGGPDAHIREYAEDFDSLNSDEVRKDFCRKLIQDGIDSFKSSLLAVIAEFPAEHFRHDRPAPSVLPHTWPTDTEQREQRATIELLRNILSKLTSTDGTVMSRLLENSAHGIFESLKTLIGYSAKAHSGQGYPPCLGILPLLLVRALSRSGKWNNCAIENLLSNITWTPKVRTISLCSSFQERALIREWLREIGDTLLPMLALNHDKSSRSDLSRIELNEDGRFFRLIFSSKWEGLLPKMQADSMSAGSTYDTWRNANRKFAVCGPGVGWDTSCAVNVYFDNNQTIWDFRINREIV